MSVLTLEVKEIIEDAPNLKTYVFEHGLRAKPGQFVMVWMPGVDEVPMSIGWQSDTQFHLSIALAGDCTKAIHEQIKVGDKLGMRGPYGNPFTHEGYKNIVLVGGGCGMPPMLSLAQSATKAGVKTTVLLGGRTKDHLLFEKKFKDLGCEIHAATDDGSKGHKGFVTDVLEKELEKGGVDCVYTCGPEMMMVKVAQLAQDYNTPSQVSLERYMKCGFGICGQCCIDGTGLRVCKDGPVFPGEVALKHQEFGKYKRDSAGVKIGLDGCRL
ncbi:dihydroorotate dehydrogenase electron transfer subunit [Patescibacteria group bacterium]|nr:dihydroorotate dehydrogenase electron transfer subunit [Patescibacteria group bacterium]MBU1683324.1 dihydroorotate dehydrogenase electron transfer subunit [Patescibacteria group bacterium]